MKRPLCLALLTVLAAACAHQPTIPEPLIAKPLAAVGALEESICLGYPMHASLVFSGKPLDATGRELAFKNYYQSMLDVKGESDYVDCLKQRWRVPLLHAEYRRGRGWLKSSRRSLAQAERWITPEQRLSAVTEEFAEKDSVTTVHRIHLAFADGSARTIEESFATPDEVKKEDSEMRALDARVKEAAQAADQTK